MAAARVLPLLGLLAIPLALAPHAAAQPGAFFTESGYVQIWVYANGSGGRFGRDAEDIVETDVIDEILIGNNGLVDNQTPGSMTIAGAGTQETSRAIGDVEIDVGDLTINGSYVTGDIDLGVTTYSQFHDPSPGNLTFTLSEIVGDVHVGNGTLGASFCMLDDITVREDGHAIIDNCTVDHVSATAGAEIDITHSNVTASLPNYRGDVYIANSALSSVQGTIVDGTIQIGDYGQPVSWDATQTITVGANSVATDLTVVDADIESAIAVVRGGGATTFLMTGAATWNTTQRFQISSVATPAEVRGGSRLSSDDQLWLSTMLTVGSSVESDSFVQVGGDLDIGRTSDASANAGGTLTVEDGGVVEVDGTLFIRPLAVVNLEPGGVLRVGALANTGTLNENGGTLIVPEPTAAALASAAIAALALRARSRDIR
jgi:hypothetical protein